MRMAKQVIAEGIAGNDIVVAHNGNIYVTNPGGNNQQPRSLISPGGERSWTPGCASPMA
jgi:hypothetical protein